MASIIFVLAAIADIYLALRVLIKDFKSRRRVRKNSENRH